MERISPRPKVPISATNTSVPGARCSFSVRERPPVLLKLAGLARTLRAALTRWRTYSFVVVLPYDPVMATVVGSTWRSLAVGGPHEATGGEPLERTGDEQRDVDDDRLQEAEEGGQRGRHRR